MCVCEPQVNCTWKLFAGGTGENFTEVDGERLLSAVVATHEHLLVPGCVNIPPGQKRPEFGFFCLATESGLRFSEPIVYLASTNVSESRSCRCGQECNGNRSRRRRPSMALRIWTARPRSGGWASGCRSGTDGAFQSGVVRHGSWLRRDAARRPVHSPHPPGTRRLVHDLGRAMSGNSSRRDQSDGRRHGDSAAECSNGTDHHGHCCAKVAGPGDP
jgi:hypothetical protein